jgi:hypothetical protein
VKSENTQLLKMINILFQHLQERGIHAIYHGGDQGVLYKKYLGEEKPRRFVIRLVKRDLIHKGRRRNCCDLARVVPTPYETILIVYEDGKEKKRTVQYNAIKVKLPDFSHKFYFVVVKGFGLEPMMLLTSCAVQISTRKKVPGG